MWKIQDLTKSLNDNAFSGKKQRKINGEVMPSIGMLYENNDFWNNYYKNLGIITENINSNQGAWKTFEQDSNNKYNKFTNYVIGNLDNSEVLAYLKALKSVSPKWSGWKYVNDDNSNFTITDPINFTSAYKKAREDQDGGFGHFTALLLDDPIIESEKKQPTEEDDKDPGNKGVGGNPYLKGLNDISLIKSKAPKLNWSDYIPIGAITGNTIGMNNAVANLKKQYKIALEEPHRKEAIVTDAYFTRSQLAKIAKLLNWLGAKSNNSDLNKHLATVGKYQDKASEYVSKMLEAREKEFNLTSDKVNEASAYNTKESVNKRNINLEKIVAKNNQMLAAEAERITKNKTAINSAINNTFTSLGNYIKDEKINAARFEKYEKIKNYEAQIKLFEKLYNEISNLKFSDYLEITNKSINYSDLPEDLKQGYYSAQDKSAYLDEHASKIPNLYNQYVKYKTDKQKEITGLALNLRHQLRLELNMPELIYNNQLDFLGAIPKQNREYTFLKSGGVMQRERASVRNRQTAWEKIHQKELLDSRRNAIEREKLFLKNLSETLGTLSKEDIIFLKKMFS